MDTSRSRAIASAPAVTIPYIETVVTYGMRVPFTTGGIQAKLLINVRFISVENYLKNFRTKIRAPSVSFKLKSIHLNGIVCCWQWKCQNWKFLEIHEFLDLGVWWNNLDQDEIKMTEILADGVLLNSTHVGRQWINSPYVHFQYYTSQQASIPL